MEYYEPELLIVRFLLTDCSDGRLPSVFLSHVFHTDENSKGAKKAPNLVTLTAF